MNHVSWGQRRPNINFINTKNKSVPTITVENSSEEGIDKKDGANLSTQAAISGSGSSRQADVLTDL